MAEPNGTPSFDPSVGDRILARRAQRESSVSTEVGDSILARRARANPAVIDGDTHTAPDGTRVRADGIQAPEMGFYDSQYEAGGYSAKKRYEELLATGQYALEERNDSDFAGRRLAKMVNKSGQSIEAQLVREGYALPFMDDGDTEIQQAQRDSLDAQARGEVLPGITAKQLEFQQSQGNSYDPRGWQSRAMARGIDNLQATLGASLEAGGLASGMESLREYGEGVKDKNLAEAAESPADIQSWREADSGLKVLKYIAETTLENIPQFGLDVGVGLAAALAAPATGGASLAAAAGGVAARQSLMTAGRAALLGTTAKSGFNRGMIAAMYPQMVGESFMSMEGAGVDDQAAAVTALGTGLINTGLEKIGMDAILRSFKMGDPGAVARVRDIFTETAKAAGLAVPTEGLTELSQQVVNEIATIAHKPDHVIDREALMESFFRGAAGGGGLATIGRGTTASLEYVGREPAPAPPATGQTTPPGPVPPTEGGPDAVTTAEPRSDLDAQFDRFVRRSKGRNAFFVSAENADSFDAYLSQLPEGAEAEVTEEGLFITRDKDAMKAYRVAQADPARRDRIRARLLGYTQTKADVADPATSVVTRTIDARGATVAEEVSDRETAAAVAEKQSAALEEGDRVEQLSVEDALRDREARRAGPAYDEDEVTSEQLASDDYDRFAAEAQGGMVGQNDGAIRDGRQERGQESAGDSVPGPPRSRSIRGRVVRVNRSEPGVGDTLGRSESVAAGAGPDASAGEAGLSGRAGILGPGAEGETGAGEGVPDTVSRRSGDDGAGDGPRPRLSGAAVGEIVAASNAGDVEAKAIVTRAARLRASAEKMSTPEAFAQAVIEIREDADAPRGVPGAPRSPRSTSDPDVVRGSIEALDAANSETAIEQNAAAFDEVGFQLGKLNRLFGPAFKEGLAAIQARYPTLVITSGQVRGPDGRITQQAQHDFKRFDTVQAAEAESDRLSELYPDGLFEVYDEEGSFILLESVKPPELRAEPFNETALTRKWVAKIRANAATAIRSALSPRNANNDQRRRDELDKIVVVRGQSGKISYFHGPTITELGQQMHGQEDTITGSLESELMFFSNGLTALVNRGYEVVGERHPQHPDGAAIPQVVASPKRPALTQVPPNTVIARSQNQSLRVSDALAERSPRSAVDYDETVAELEQAEELINAEWAGLDAKSFSDGLRARLEDWFWLNSSDRGDGPLSPADQAREKRARKNAKNNAALAKRHVPEAYEARKNVRALRGAMSGNYDNTAFDKADIVEEANGMEGAQDERAFGETREENKEPRRETDVLGRIAQPDPIRENTVDFYGSIPVELVNWVRGVAEILGLGKGVAIIDASSKEAMDGAARRGGLAAGAVAGAKKRFADSSSLKAFTQIDKDSGRVVIFTNFPQGMATEGMAFVLAHELGHNVYRRVTQDVLDKHRAKLMPLFEAAKRRAIAQGVSKDHQYLYDDVDAAFEEWFSDEFSSWMIEESGNPGALQRKSRKPFLVRIFQQVRNLMRSTHARIQELAAEGYPRQRLVSPEFSTFMQDVLRQGLMNEPRVEGAPAFDESPLAAAVRSETPRGRVVQHMKRVGDTIKDIPRIFPLVFTSDRELRTMGDVGTQIADWFSQQSSSVRHAGVTGVSYFQGLSHQRAVWMQKWDNIADSLGDTRTLEALEELARADDRADPSTLTADGQRVNSFFLEYRDKYLVKRLPNIGRLSIYAPRMFDVGAIETRRAEFEALLMQHAGVGQDTAVEIADGIIASGGSADFSFSVENGRMAPNFSASMQRTLRGPSIAAALRDGGFAAPVGGESVLGYITSSTKFAEYARINEGHRLERLLQQLQGADRDRAQYIIQGYMGRIGLNADRRAVTAMSWVQVYQSYLTLMFSAVASIPDLAGPVLRSRDMDGVKAATRAWTKAFRDSGTVKERARLRGLLEERMTHQALREAYGQMSATGTARKMMNRLFHWNGQEYLTNMSRVASMAVAEEFLVNNARRAASGHARAQRYMQELNVTAEQVLAWDRGGRQVAEAGSDSAVESAIHQFVDESVIRPNAAQRPTWANHPMAMLLWHLKSFFWAYGKVVVGGIAREAQSRFKEAGSVPAGLAGATVPLAIAGMMLLPLAALARELREEVQYVGMRERQPTNRQDTAEYLMGRVHDAGVFGPFELLFGAGRFGGGVDDVAVSLAGPAFEHLWQVGDGPTWSLLRRSTPGMSQLPWLNDLVKDRVVQ